MNKILFYFIHFWTDLDRIRYMRCPQKSIE